MEQQLGWFASDNVRDVGASGSESGASCSSINHDAAGPNGTYPVSPVRSRGLGIGASCSGSRSIDRDEKSKRFGEGVVRLLDERYGWHPIVKQRFLSGLNCYGLHTDVKGIHQITYSSSRRRARLEAFSGFARAAGKDNGGGGEDDGGARYAWYGGSKEEIDTIIKYGFVGDSSRGGGFYGRGVHLSPVEYPLDSLESCIEDEDGLRHVLLCRVVLGRMEEVRPGSGQTHPSREDFDSGVDNLASPRKFIVWSTNVNTHVLPEFVVSFKADSSLQECERRTIPLKKPPSSPWMPFPALLTQLSRNLPADAINLIKKHHRDNKERKITRQELVQRVRSIAGDELLISAIKSYRNMIERHDYQM